MKILRSVNRRNFNIEPAGYFNVLRPGRRFVTSRLPIGFHYPLGQSKATDREHADPQDAARPLQIMQPGTRELGVLRPALIVLAAIAITVIALSWIDGNLFAHNFGW
jgi:hypothetical protein